MREKTDISNRLDAKYMRIKPDFDPGEEFKMNKYIVQIEQRWDEGKKGGRSALKKDLMIERGKLQNEEKAKQERVAKKEAEPSAEKKKHTPPAFPNKGRKKFVAPMAKLDGMSEFGGETPIKNPLQSTEDQQIVSSIYGNKDLSESREK